MTAYFPAVLVSPIFGNANKRSSRVEWMKQLVRTMGCTSLPSVGDIETKAGHRNGCPAFFLPLRPTAALANRASNGMGLGHDLRRPVDPALDREARGAMDHPGRRADACGVRFKAKPPFQRPDKRAQVNGCGPNDAQPQTYEAPNFFARAAAGHKASHRLLNFCTVAAPFP